MSYMPIQMVLIASTLTNLFFKPNKAQLHVKSEKLVL